MTNATPRPLYPPEKRTNTHFIGGWVDPKTGLDKCGKTHPYRESILKLASPKQVAIPTELSWPTLNRVQCQNIFVSVCGTHEETDLQLQLNFPLYTRRSLGNDFSFVHIILMPITLHAKPINNDIHVNVKQFILYHGVNTMSPITQTVKAAYGNCHCSV